MAFCVVLEPTANMRKLTIVFFDAGGGHRNAAEAGEGFN